MIFCWEHWFVQFLPPCIVWLCNIRDCHFYHLDRCSIHLIDNRLSMSFPGRFLSHPFREEFHQNIAPWSSVVQWAVRRRGYLDWVLTPTDQWGLERPPDFSLPGQAISTDTEVAGERPVKWRAATILSDPAPMPLSSSLIWHLSITFSSPSASMPGDSWPA